MAGLAGSLAGGLVMFVAPGNKFRQSAFPPHPHIPELLGISMRGLREFFQLTLLAAGSRIRLGRRTAVRQTRISAGMIIVR